MLTLSVKTSAEDLIRRLRVIREDQIPFALAKALTDTAEDVRAELTGTLPRIFDRPTPYTLNSVYKLPATKKRLVSKVALKDDAGKGIAAQKFLAAQVRGGPRRHKRSESALKRVGLLSEGEFISPGKRAQIDAFGNQTSGEIVQFLSALKAFSEQGYNANRTAASLKRLGPSARQFFVSRGGRLRRGVWERVKEAGEKRVRPIAIFGRPANYSKRFDFYGIAEKQVASSFASRFAESINYALRTAR